MSPRIPEQLLTDRILVLQQPWFFMFAPSHPGQMTPSFPQGAFGNEANVTRGGFFPSGVNGPITTSSSLSTGANLT